MDAANLANTIQKAVTPQTSSVAVSSSRVIEEKVSLQPEAGQPVPQEVKESQVNQAEQIKETVKDLNSFVQNVQRGIQFSVQEETGRSIITVTDKDTGDVIRSFPSEDMLAIAAHLAETLALPEEAGRGLLIEVSA